MIINAKYLTMSTDMPNPDTWLCPVSSVEIVFNQERELPCLEVLREITTFRDREPRGTCPIHGTFRWSKVGGWVR